MEISIESDDDKRGSLSAFRSVLNSRAKQSLAEQDGNNIQGKGVDVPQPLPQRRLDPQETTVQDAIPKLSQHNAGQKGGSGSAPPLTASSEFGSIYLEKTKNSKLKDDDSTPKNRFVGVNVIQYGLWAHYLSYCCAFMCFIFGVFAIAWDSPPPSFSCSIKGQSISTLYKPTESGECNVTYFSLNDQRLNAENVCCYGNEKSSLKGNAVLGALYMLYSVVLVAMEDTTIGFGLLYPNDSIFYDYQFSCTGLLHFGIGIAGCVSYATALPGVCLMVNAAVLQYAMRRQECGDGGRSARVDARLKSLALREGSAPPDQSAISQVRSMITEQADLLREALRDYLPSIGCRFTDPRKFLVRIYNEDKLSSYVWTGIFFLINAIVFFVTLAQWQRAIAQSQWELLSGTLDVLCDSAKCAYNRQLVKSGPMSDWAPWAKASGACLNLDCSLLLLPVIKMILRRLNNSGESLASAQNSTDCFSKFLARPITRYLPIQKNIEFHKLCAWTVLFFTAVHTIAHLANLRWSDDTTIVFFKKWGWIGTSYFTGAVVTLAMLIIFSASSNMIRHTKYEIFFKAHHFFVLFYFFMFLHGPNFIYWSVVPVLLYVIERYLQIWRGNQPILVTKVEWIAPVLAVYFRPVLKDAFQFKEGQYLYLNCPYISATEWHPFTISSAQEDLTCGGRVCLETGEEVEEVPRPPDLPTGAKWSYFYPVSRNWQDMAREEYLEKSETEYHDYLSVHIRVHGLDGPDAKTWTRRLKEYFELMAAVGGPSESAGGKHLESGKAPSKFPFFFTHREPRGDILMGRQVGPDGTQILRVDGPHSAPSEHYINYGTVMLIGAGIGLTPCASILSALARYRWKRNFNPEILHFYWMVRQSEIESYQWFIHMLTELSFEIKKARESKQIDPRYYVEINVYVTGSERGRVEPKPFARAQRPLGSSDGSDPQPHFQGEELYSALLNPTVSAKDQIKTMKGLQRFSVPGAENDAVNRLQDIFIWSGRPEWDAIFKEMKESRQTTDIGVCFCGAAAIGAELVSLCAKYSDVKDDCLFTLHKENF